MAASPSCFFIYQQKCERAGPFRHPLSQLPGNGTRRELSVVVRSLDLIRANPDGATPPTSHFDFPEHHFLSETARNHHIAEELISRMNIVTSRHQQSNRD